MGSEGSNPSLSASRGRGASLKIKDPELTMHDLVIGIVFWKLGVSYFRFWSLKPNW